MWRHAYTHMLTQKCMAEIGDCHSIPRFLGLCLANQLVRQVYTTACRSVQHNEKDSI